MDPTQKLLWSTTCSSTNRFTTTAQIQVSHKKQGTLDLYSYKDSIKKTTPDSLQNRSDTTEINAYILLMASSISEIWSFSWFHCSGFREIPFFPGFISPSEFIQYSLMSIRTLPLKSLTLTYLIFPIWNMLSSPLLGLEDPPCLELSPLFGFLAGFSCTVGFLFFASKEPRNTYQIVAMVPHQRWYIYYL